MLQKKAEPDLDAVRDTTVQQVDTCPAVFSILWTNWFVVQTHALRVLFDSTVSLRACLPFLREFIAREDMYVCGCQFSNVLHPLIISSVYISGGAVLTRTVISSRGGNQKG